MKPSNAWVPNDAGWWLSERTKRFDEWEILFTPDERFKVQTRDPAISPGKVSQRKKSRNGEDRLGRYDTRMQ